MEKYGYYEAVENDVREYINRFNLHNEYNSESEAEDKLYDEMFQLDAVTGNGSGSYTFSRWTAEEYLCHNLDLLQEACEEFCCHIDEMIDNTEACDVTIRCYLLPQMISKVVREQWEEEEEEENNN